MGPLLVLSSQYDQERSHPENQATMFPGPADGTQFFFSTKKLEKSLAYGQTRTWLFLSRRLCIACLVWIWLVMRVTRRNE